MLLISDATQVKEFDRPHLRFLLRRDDFMEDTDSFIQPFEDIFLALGNTTANISSEPRLLFNK
jgi:hypothetical protein